MERAPRFKHPEWVLFYQRGITPVKIAELNNVPASKVRGYLWNAARSHPDLFASRLMVHDHPRPRPAGRPDPERHWRAQLERYTAYLAEHGHRPQGDMTTAEGKLAHWLTCQRSDDRLGKLPAHRANRLDAALPDWRTDTRQLAYDDQWRAAADRVAAYKRDTGRWPRAHWLHRQRRMHRDGTLRDDRRAYLNQHLPGWDAPPTRSTR